MRICLVNALFHPFSGGVEKHMLELGRHLVGLGVEVHVLTGRFGNSPAEEMLHGIHVHRIPCTELRIPRLYPPPMVLSPGVQKALASLDEKHSFDLIHLQNRWFPDFDAALLYARSARKPFVITLHNARPVGIALHYTVLGGLYDALIGRQVLKSADRIISVSRWGARDVSKYGIPLSRFTVVPNGIELSDYTPCSNPEHTRVHPIRKKLGVGTDPLLVFVGRVILQKGLTYLLLAMPAVLREHPNAKLVIVGKGDKLTDLEKQARELGINNSVKFMGFVPDSELRQVHQAADVFVLPSLWEVLPIAVLEAMACGKPVVCTDAGGNRELVLHGKNGLIVPKRNPYKLAHAVNRLLSDPSRRFRMGKAGRRHAEKHFNWPNIAQKTIKVYERVIRDYRPRPSTFSSERVQEQLLEFNARMRSFSRTARTTSAQTLFKRARESISNLRSSLRARRKRMLAESRKLAHSLKRR